MCSSYQLTRLTTRTSAVAKFTRRRTKMSEQSSLFGRVSALLRRPFPPPRPGVGAVVVAGAVGCFIALFLWYFEPFGIGNMAYRHRPGRIAGFGLLTTAAFIWMNVVLPRVLAEVYRVKNWTVGKQALHYLVLLLLIATGNGLYINYLRGLSFDWYNYAWIIRATMALGSIPLVLLLLAEYTLRLRKSLELASEVNHQLHTSGAEEAVVTKPVPAALGGILYPATFSHASSEGNYVRIYHSDRKAVLQRYTLRDLVDGLSGFDQIIRCHRGHVVNVDQVISATGNAQGLQLNLTSGANVPVSRRYVPALRRQLEARPLSVVT